MTTMPPLICLIGPTAIGKTALAFALADRYPVHLISVDSAQIYQQMDIGTAKPDIQTLQTYPHALIDLIPPEESYSAAQFCQDAQKEITYAYQAGKIPIFVGGTMMYYLAFFEGLADLPTSTPQARAKIEARLNTEGAEKLYQELVERDPHTAAQISVNDRQRLTRFSELMLLTEQTPSELFAAQSHQHPKYATLAIALNTDRKHLHERIAARFQSMMQAGFLEEVRMLKDRPLLTAEHPSMRSVGYRQLWQYLDGQFSLDEATEQGIIATRQLAKRQITWMNNRLQKSLTFHFHDPLADSTSSTPLNQIDQFLQTHPLP